MTSWQDVIISPSMPIINALQIIEKSSLQIALVVDDNRTLLGTITDGDVRRAILRNVSLGNCAEEIMQKSPVTLRTHASNEEILNLMKKYEIRQIPILDDDNRVVDLKVLMHMVKPEESEFSVVIMAGGLGTRLRPLTDECPKPLLKIGNKPLLETIIENLRDSGFRKFYITVNYKAEMISNYFADGRQWDISITYIKEKKPLGTAGALSLLPEKPIKPVLVMNGDLLTKVNFNQLLVFHHETKAAATMCVRQYDFEVPYGVVKADKHQFMKLDEKPMQRFFVNAGIYVLSPEIFEFFPYNEYLDMTTLFNLLIQQNREAVIFPIHEYWMDIGKISDYKIANGDYEKHFND